MGSIARLDFMQADNQLRTFTKETGGWSFSPFLREFPGIFRAIADTLRNQYSIAYQPNNQARDGKFRKIKVELVNPATNEPLRITDEKNKPIKYSVVTRNGYNAPRRSGVNAPRKALAWKSSTRSCFFPIRYKRIDSSISALLS